MIGRLRQVIPPLSPRDPEEAHRSATPLELFSDLCYVVAVAQAALQLHHAIAEGHAIDGLAHFGIAFFAIWWAWLNFSWFNSAYDPDDVPHRVLTLLQIFGSLVLAAGIPDVFHNQFTLAIIGYVVMRIGLVLMWLRAAHGHREGRDTALRYGIGLLLVQAGWVGGMLATGGHLPVWLLVLLVLAEFGVPLVAEKAGPSPWHPHHIAERYGLFYIIVLGETILAVTVALQQAFAEEEPPTELWSVVIGGVLITFGAWWLYFSREDADVLENASAATDYFWGFGHYFIFGSAAAVGAALAGRIEFYAHHGHSTDLITSAFVAGSVATLTTALWAVMVRLHDPSLRTAIKYLGAAIAGIATTWLPLTELWAGFVVVILLVREVRASARS